MHALSYPNYPFKYTYMVPLNRGLHLEVRSMFGKSFLELLNDTPIRHSFINTTTNLITTLSCKSNAISPICAQVGEVRCTKIDWKSKGYGNCIRHRWSNGSNHLQR